MDAAPVRRQAPPEIAVTPRGTETVLLVEDEDALRTLAREILTGRATPCSRPAHRPEAIRLAREHGQTIHLLLTDVVMPQMSGRQLAETLAAARPGLKVLYMSGYTDDTVGTDGVLEAGVHFLQKPFTPQGLGRKVREVLTV